MTQRELPASDEDVIAAIDRENEAREAMETATAAFNRARAHRIAVMRTRGVLP